MAEYDKPFDAAVEDNQNETPTLSKVLRDAVDGALYELHTCLPGIITKVLDNGFVDVQPLLKRKYISEKDPIDLPIIQSVPVVFPRGADYSIKLPYKVGDTGEIRFHERSLSKWLVSGGYVSPDDTRKHDISDATFCPGLYPKSDIIAGDADDMILTNGAAQLFVKKSGKFKLKNSSQELLDVLDQLLDKLIVATNVDLLLGSAPFTTATITDLLALKVKLATLKDS